MNTLSFKKAQQGFTLIELMIVVAIIGILASIAIPAYQDYIRNAKFSEATLATASLKVAVEVCAQDQNALTNCTAGSNGIPANLTTPSKYVATVATAGGTITSTAISTLGLSGQNIILKPAYTAATDTVPASPVTWTIDPASTCIAARLCKI